MSNVKTYKIRQYINGKLTSFIKVSCTYEDYKALKSLIFFPKDGEIVDYECIFYKFYIFDDTSKKKKFFSFFTSSDISTKHISKVLSKRMYDGIKVDYIGFFLVDWRIPKNYIRQGRQLEEKTSKALISQGYEIINHYEKSTDDEGIDIIANKGDITLLVQCKNWNIPQITQKELKEFLGSCYLFLYKNKEYRKRKIRRVFVTKDNDYSSSAKKLLSEYYPFIECFTISQLKKGIDNLLLSK